MPLFSLKFPNLTASTLYSSSINDSLLLSIEFLFTAMPFIKQDRVRGSIFK